MKNLKNLNLLLLTIGVLLSIYTNKEGQLKLGLMETKAQTAPTSWSLINPPQSSLHFYFDGGQAIEYIIRNENILGVTLIVKSEPFNKDIFSGIILPRGSELVKDYIYDHTPIRYRYNASTASDVAHISFIQQK